MSPTENRLMALAGIGPITMTRCDAAGDFESCDNGWSRGQALCAHELNKFFVVHRANVIEVIPKLRPARNRVKIETCGEIGYLYIDGERWNLYTRTVKVANHWIYKGYSYVQIEVIE